MKYRSFNDKITILCGNLYENVDLFKNRFEGNNFELVPEKK